MVQHFSTKMAKEVGIIPAILYEDIMFCVEGHTASRTNFFDGEYWAFYPEKSYEGLFPYLTRKQITTALNVLEEQGYIKVGNNGYITKG